MGNDRQRIRVYTDMVGDLFHWGHVAFLERARQLGSELWVGVHADDDVTEFKRRPIMKYEERLAVIAACRHVDGIVPAAPLVITDELLDAHEIDVVVHGDDFSPEVLEAVYGVPLRRGMMRTVPYSGGISTTETISRLLNRSDDSAAQDRTSDPALAALRSTRRAQPVAA
jgi:cytidyltransferase-like protein